MVRFVAGSNYGDHYAIFEQGTRNKGVGIAGKNIANPSGVRFAAANMLKYLGLEQLCSTIKKNIGDTSTTTQFVECVLNEIVKMTPTIGFSYEMQKPNLGLRYKTVD
ncbi:unnamed protein product [Rotaria sordida]|uniref:Isopropylmalate dehydrogenase-like domain-containing protein n=1 Tax=Rotaria sordida TaxID=392033 RepID=A0A813S6U9_9BILA|nr:unnamed protein product [Rotaria sordida]CAF3740873.1 unnamed protein product [Rotaria sordida]